MDESASVTDYLLRVLIVDGDGRVRRGLRALLEAQPDIVVIGEAATAAQAEQCSAALRPSVVLLDLMLPTLDDGLAAVRFLAAHKQPCVAISWHAGLREVALEMGAGDFVAKGSSSGNVLAAIRGACHAADQRGSPPQLQTEVSPSTSYVLVEAHHPADAGRACAVVYSREDDSPVHSAMTGGGMTALET